MIAVNNFRDKTIFGWSKLALLSALTLLLAIFSIAGVSYFAGKNQSDKVASPIPVIDLSAQQQILGVASYNWNGTVSDIHTNDSFIVFSTQYRDADNVIQSKEIRVDITPDTTILKWDVTNPSPTNNPAERQTISVADIQPGQQITVQTSYDIINHDRVTAQSISVLLTPLNT